MKKLLYTDFLKQATKRPENLALVNGEVKLSYGELSQIARNLASHIKPQAKENTLIAIFMYKGWEQVVAALAIVLSGAAYLPIDPELPEEKIKQLLTIGEVNVVITQGQLKEKILGLTPDILVHEVKQDEPSSLSRLNSFNFLQNEESLAYVIFTSGSTGEPKGVAIQHFAAVNTIEDINTRFKTSENDSILALSELNFDLSVYDIFGLLSVGGKIVIPELSKKRSPSHWQDLIQKESISLWNSVPAFFQMLVDTYPESIHSPLRLCLLSGDWLPLEVIATARKVAPNLKLISLGGATEASIWSVFYEITTLDKNWKSIPYGKALSQQTIEVLNEALLPCEAGVIGEIYIGGLGLAKEYWRNRGKTDASFILDNKKRRRLYKTGDLGKYLPDGNIEFLGRADFQVKINGYRIELGAIEAELRKVTNIEKCVVVAKAEALYAYVVSHQKIDTKAAIELLKQKLPLYMCPTKIFQITELPLTSNGKIDRNQLIAYIHQGLNENQKIVPATTDIEKFLVSLWEKLFNYHPIGIEDNFFALGGGSLLATQLITKINHIKNLDFPISLIFECPTIKKLAQRIHQKENYSLAIQMAEGENEPLFLIHPISGQIFCYAALANTLNKQQKIIALELPPTLNNDSLTIEKLATHYIHYIQSHSKPPYRIAGWSMGGLIAYEIARQLGFENVIFLGLIDTFPPRNLFSLDHTQASLSHFSFTVLDYFRQEVEKVLKSPININLDKFAKLNPIHGIEKLAQYIKAKYLLELKEQLNFFDNFSLAFKNILKGLLNYKIEGKFAKKIHFFKSDEMPSLLMMQWEKLSVAPLSIKQYPSSHLGILTTPSVETLSRELLALLGEQS
jgi:amino acid adenylation domain-containing protein